MRILTVDDDPSTQTILAAALRSIGHEVTAVSDAAEALRLVASERISLVVTDWLMPGVDGLEVRHHCDSRT